MNRIGFVINPIAGMGGAVGLKGTDGMAEEALARGAAPRAAGRAAEALRALAPYAAPLTILTCGGAMGSDALSGAGIAHTVAYHPSDTTSAGDTMAACRAFCAAGVEAIVFCGGDGTARDIASVVGATVPILGIPSGVKMYSDVFALTPRAAAEVVAGLADGTTCTRDASVMDIDEGKYRHGELDRTCYAEVRALSLPAKVQAPKCAFRSESDDVSKHDIARFASEFMQDGSLYIVGVGSTTQAVLASAGIEGTLLGVDLVQGGRLVCRDATEQDILQAMQAVASVKILVSPLGAQGFVFGRGNHQISPAVIRRVGRDNIILLGTPHKLQNTPQFYVDTGDTTLDRDLSGFMSVVCGYHLAARKAVCAG
ncbi:MAG: ATP-NAD kinase family protein [Candidatus Methanofastidiosa archaeon]|nr:ATP-NAD kinase family protein [Candidatus Methanofastidiosa archaeon]